MKKLALCIICLAAVFSSFSVKAQSKGDAIVGVFLMKTPDTGDESKLQIFRAKNGTYSGKVVWVKNPNNPDGSPCRDTKNPDPKLRNRTADNLPVLFNLKYDADDNEWVDGDLYNPNDGKWFKIKIKGFSSAETLEVRYYKGVPLLGKNDQWQKVSN